MKMMTQQSKIMKENIEKNDFIASQIMIGNHYLEMEKYKPLLVEYHELLENVAMYQPIKQAILDDPSIETFHGTPLTRYHSMLEMSKKIRDSDQSYRNRLFMNFTSNN